MKSRKLNDGLFPYPVPRCLRIYVYLTTRVCKNIVSPTHNKKVKRNRRVVLVVYQVAVLPRVRGKNDERSPRPWSVERTATSPSPFPLTPIPHPFLLTSPPGLKPTTMSDPSHQHTSLPPTDTINAFSQSGDDEEEIDQLDPDSDQDEQIPIQNSTKKSRRRSGERTPGQPLLSTSKLSEILKSDGTVPVATNRVPVSDADSRAVLANNPSNLSKEAMFILSAATVCGFHACHPRGSSAKLCFQLHIGRVHQAARSGWPPRE